MSLPCTWTPWDQGLFRWIHCSIPSSVRVSSTYSCPVGISWPSGMLIQRNHFMSHHLATVPWIMAAGFIVLTQTPDSASSFISQKYTLTKAPVERYLWVVNSIENYRVHRADNRKVPKVVKKLFNYYWNTLVLLGLENFYGPLHSISCLSPTPLHWRSFLSLNLFNTSLSLFYFPFFCVPSPSTSRAKPRSLFFHCLNFFSLKSRHSELYLKLQVASQGMSLNKKSSNI